MDERKSAVAAMTFLFATLVVVAVVLGSYCLYRSHKVVLENELTNQLEELNASTEPPFTRPNRRVMSPGKIGRDHVERLQVLLIRTSELLEMRNKELEKKDREHEALRADLSAALDLLADFVGRDDEGLSALNELSTAKTKRQRTDNDAGRHETEESIEELKHRLELYDREMALQTLELEELRRDLAEINADMLEDRLIGGSGSPPNLETVLTADTIFTPEIRHAIIHAFIDLGSASVPVLVDLLDHDRPEVRRLAANALGELGELAHDAEGPLTTALADIDTTVSESARVALSKIR